MLLLLLICKVITLRPDEFLASVTAKMITFSYRHPATVQIELHQLLN